jgi:hypothetical protein
VWQELYEELKGHGFMVIAVAMDSREGAALPWIEAARPTYVTLIDRDHRLAELYGMVNVPQAVWIDERGIVVRPTETAGAYEGFRKMDREHVFDAERARAHVPRPTDDMARAHLAFRLGQRLMRSGRAEEGDRWLAEASRLHPDSWCMWRQRAGWPLCQISGRAWTRSASASTMPPST